MPQGEISSWPLRVAIIGGGIAGGLVAAGLEKYPNIDAHIYEASKDFWERGAGVGLSVNARRALDLISPEAGKTLERAGAVPMHPDARLYMGRGPEEGKMVFELAHEVTQLTVDRRTWVMRILECVPEERKHGGKKSKNIVEKGDEIEISFEDGTTVHADVVIGADGIHSAVRKYMFGADSELTKPVFRHCYHYFNIVPREDAMAKMDPKYFEQDCQLGFVGGGGFMMHDVNENGKMIQVAAMFPHEGEWPSEKWVLPADRHIVREELKEWGDHGRGVAEVLLQNPELTKWSLWTQPDAPTYAKGNILIMGDAAHAFEPWMGSGAGQSIEDAMMLSILLGRVKSKSEVQAALLAFDYVRRPRTQHIGHLSHDSGRIMFGLDEDVGNDLVKMREKLTGRWDYIWDIDFNAHIKEAEDYMDSLLKGKQPTEREGWDVKLSS